MVQSYRTTTTSSWKTGEIWLQIVGKIHDSVAAGRSGPANDAGHGRRSCLADRERMARLSRPGWLADLV